MTGYLVRFSACFASLKAVVSAHSQIARFTTPRYAPHLT
jgi:hypothetical protein